MAPNIVGTLIAGNNMVLEADTLTNGVTQFKFDASGAFINNGRMYMQSAGGRIGFDPNYGILGGTTNLFQITDTGAMKPSCIDADGNLILENGFPKDTNFWLGIDGKAYFRGNVCANNFYFNDGNNVRTLLDQATKKFDLSDLDFIDLGGIQIDGKNNNINFSGTGSITWSANNFPVQSEFSTAATGPWHSDQQANDKYRRDKLFDGTWGTPYQFVGSDGQPGSDASVPRYITQSGITETTISSPKIYAGQFYATDGSPTYAEMDNEGFSIYNTSASLPKAQLASKDDGQTIWFSLGAGSGATPTSDRFIAIKRSGFTQLCHYGSGSNASGFKLNSDGTIDVIGTLNANATAVFG